MSKFLKCEYFMVCDSKLSVIGLWTIPDICGCHFGLSETVKKKSDKMIYRLIDSENICEMAQLYLVKIGNLHLSDCRKILRTDFS